MRKVIPLFVLLFAMGGSYAQTLIKEHAFDDQLSVNIQMVRLENSGLKTCVVNKVDSITFACIFYNTDYTEYKTVLMDLSPLIKISDYNTPDLVIHYISENTFDLDPDIDILCQFTYYDSKQNLYAQVIVFHENGSVLFSTDIELSNAFLITSSIANGSVLPSLFNTSQGTKMILDAYYVADGKYSFDVYSLPGSVPTYLKNVGQLAASDNYLNAYPIPANDFVNMDYKLAGDQNSGEIEIVDQQGRMVQKIAIDKNQGNLRIPVRNYSNGIYFYKLNSKRGMPRTCKVLIMK
jgi:hypothetical protein